jgi:hypothetical protein
MPKNRTSLNNAMLAVLFLVMGPIASVSSMAPPKLTTSYDVEAFFVAPTDALSLQAALSAHTKIRLGSGSYAANCTIDRKSHNTTCDFQPFNLTLSSGMQIWGLPR